MTSLVFQIAKQGQIRNRNYAQQIRDFSGLCYGKISPTDIDAFLDFGNKCFVFIETKHGGKMPPYGQLLALTRLTDACEAGGIRSLLIIAAHDTETDIEVASLAVVKYYTDKRWKSEKETVRECIDRFRTYCNIAPEVQGHNPSASATKTKEQSKGWESRPGCPASVGEGTPASSIRQAWGG